MKVFVCGKHVLKYECRETVFSFAPNASGYMIISISYNIFA